MDWWWCRRLQPWGVSGARLLLGRRVPPAGGNQRHSLLESSFHPIYRELFRILRSTKSALGVNKNPIKKKRYCHSETESREKKGIEMFCVNNV